MRKFIENYFLFFLKPSLMILSFFTNFIYLRDSPFANDFYYYIYLITFSIKPLFFLFLLIGSIITYKVNSTVESIFAILIIGGIYFGFPVKEISDYLGIEASRKFYSNLGENYLVQEYITTHFVVNLLIENLPVVIFVIINNLMIEREMNKNVFIDPLIVNFIFIGVNLGVIFCLFSGESRTR
jgi:hypothetical protein